MFRFLIPVFALALAGCQGAVAWVTPSNELQYAFLDRDDATQIDTLFNLGPVGTPTRLLLTSADQGVGLGSCVENRRTRRGELQFRNTLRLHNFQGDEVIEWTDRELARNLDNFFRTAATGSSNYERFIPQPTGSFGKTYFICWNGGPRQGKNDQIVIYVQPQFNTEIAALNVAIAFDAAGRIRAAEIFAINGQPTTVIAAPHPAGNNVLTTTGAGQILINGQPLRDPNGATVTARPHPTGGNRRAVHSVLK